MSTLLCYNQPFILWGSYYYYFSFTDGKIQGQEYQVHGPTASKWVEEDLTQLADARVWVPSHFSK